MKRLLLFAFYITLSVCRGFVDGMQRMPKIRSLFCLVDIKTRSFGNLLVCFDLSIDSRIHGQVQSKIRRAAQNVGPIPSAAPVKRD